MKIDITIERFIEALTTCEGLELNDGTIFAKSVEFGYSPYQRTAHIDLAIVEDALRDSLTKDVFGYPNMVRTPLPNGVTVVSAPVPNIVDQEAIRAQLQEVADETFKNPDDWWDEYSE